MIKVARFFEALEGMDDPMGEYLFSLGRRVDKLEHDMDILQKQMPSRAGGRRALNHADR